ncbi:MAG: 1,4-beta-xylanase [Chloroflexota bacterium]|nr:1,4-beta-xylanase [Chloroflexota bacterium]MDE2947138.1 1,4-beta-xylanase [Chloroflexota bacterium]
MTEQWTPEKAKEWYAAIEPIRGCNYLPRSAVNSTEMWQAESFDPATIAEELAWAAAAGFNAARVFHQFLVWRDDPAGLKYRIDQYLDIAAGEGIKAMFILFDDCAFAGKEPYLGPQDDPVPYTHNSGWTPSPGLTRVADRAVWPELKDYVVDIVGSFADDERVQIWDLYNEPGNSEMGEGSLPLVEAAFAWAREAGARQPLTTSIFRLHDEYEMEERILELSDVTSFHHYGETGVEAVIQRCQKYGRPVLCTEWLRRVVGQTVELILPIFVRERIGWYNWGLVAGRTQTYLDWCRELNSPDSKTWQHDIFHADGSPYDEAEIELIRSFAFD